MRETVQAATVQGWIDTAAQRFAETGEEQVVDLPAGVIEGGSLTIREGVGVRGPGYKWVLTTLWPER